MDLTRTVLYAIAAGFVIGLIMTALPSAAQTQTGFAAKTIVFDAH